MFSEDDLLPVSALQHMRYCPRQCSLIHLERAWEENRFTVEGRLLHEKVDEGGTSRRDDVLRQTGVPVRSLEMGLTGILDVVEFHGEGRVPFPVEFKRGKPKKDDCDKVQLCAQAMCLEEALGGAVPKGALFYAKTRRREPVVFDHALRETVRATARDLHAMIRSGVTPPPVGSGKCKRCSLRELCGEAAVRKRKSVSTYIAEELLS